MTYLGQIFLIINPPTSPITKWLFDLSHLFPPHDGFDTYTHRMSNLSDSHAFFNFASGHEGIMIREGNNTIEPRYNKTIAGIAALTVGMNVLTLLSRTNLDSH